MDFSTETGAIGLLLAAIAWLVKDRLDLKKGYDTALTDRQKLHDAALGAVQKAHAEHAADLKAQLATKDAQLDRHQEADENYKEQNRIQERAFMTLMAALGEKMATLSAVVLNLKK